jgi:Na+-driven multidrug efflux pump
LLKHASEDNYQPEYFTGTLVMVGTIPAFRANLVYIVGNIIGNVTLVYYFGWIGAAVATSGATVLSMIATWWYLRTF